MMDIEEAMKCLSSGRPSNEEFQIAKNVIRYLMAKAIVDEDYELPNVYHLEIVANNLRLKY